MKKQLLIGLMAVCAGSIVAADLKDDVAGAAKKVTEAGYSWKTTVTVPDENARFRPGPVEGKMAKDGLIQLSMTRGDNTTEAFLKGEKGAYKGQDGWQSIAEAAQADAGGGGQNRGRFMARMLQTFKAPAVEAAEMVAKMKDLKKDGDACVGDLTEDGVKSMFNRFRRPGGDAPEVQDAKGSAKFWIKDGQLSKFEYTVKGKITFNNNDMQIDRTTTTEIKDVGATKVEIPDDAKKKM